MSNNKKTNKYRTLGDYHESAHVAKSGSQIHAIHGQSHEVGLTHDGPVRLSYTGDGKYVHKDAAYSCNRSESVFTCESKRPLHAQQLI
jgi:hypothetical protein